MIRVLFALLQTTGIKDDIYAALWDVSRRINVRIIVKDAGAGGKEIELLNGEDSSMGWLLFPFAAFGDTIGEERCTLF